MTLQADVEEWLLSGCTNTQPERANVATTRYASLTKRLCGQAAQTMEPIPIRAYTGQPVTFPNGELALWTTTDSRAWAGFGDVRTLVSAFEVVELLAMAGGTCVLDVER